MTDDSSQSLKDQNVAMKVGNKDRAQKFQQGIRTPLEIELEVIRVTLWHHLLNEFFLIPLRKENEKELHSFEMDVNVNLQSCPIEESKDPAI